MLSTLSSPSVDQGRIWVTASISSGEEVAQRAATSETQNGGTRPPFRDLWERRLGSGHPQGA
jgi:hypothetical protein